MSIDNLELKETLAKNTSAVLKGKDLTDDKFINWIEQAENKPTNSLQEAKNKWTIKRKHLQQSIK